MSKIIVRTEQWDTAKGAIVKAVTRNEDGTFLGATNQTKPVSLATLVVGA